MKTTVLIILCSFLVVGNAAACDLIKNCSTVHEANITQIDENGIKYFECPVSGKTAAVSEKSEFVDYEGKRYYLFSTEQKSVFAENPVRFLSSKGGSEKLSESSDQVIDLKKADKVGKSCCPSVNKVTKVDPEQSGKDKKSF